ncbi:MAG: hypothetical protein PHF64_10500, partial [Methanoregula sp.]|nr:hypothetical protein [Methanoregula sp.]
RPVVRNNGTKQLKANVYMTAQKSICLRYRFNQPSAADSPAPCTGIPPAVSCCSTGISRTVSVRAFGHQPSHP